VTTLNCKLPNKECFVNSIPQPAILSGEDLALLAAYQAADHRTAETIRKRIDRRVTALFQASITFLSAGARLSADLVREQAATLRVAFLATRRNNLSAWEPDGDERCDVAYRAVLGGGAT